MRYLRCVNNITVNDNRQSKTNKKYNVKVATKYVSALERVFKNNGMSVYVCEVEMLNYGVRYNLQIKEGTKVDEVLSCKKAIAFCLGSATGEVMIENLKFGSDRLYVTVPYKKEEKPNFVRDKNNFLSNTLLDLSYKIFQLALKVHRKA